MTNPSPHPRSLWVRHQVFEKNSIILLIGILIAISIGGLVEVVPLFYLKSTIEKVDGIRPLTPLELAGRNIYVHSNGDQNGQVRTLPALAENTRMTGTATI